MPSANVPRARLVLVSWLALRDKYFIFTSRSPIAALVDRQLSAVKIGVPKIAMGSQLAVHERG
jgi:hypothetical protein